MRGLKLNSSILILTSVIESNLVTTAELHLYSTSHCHLCEEAEALLIKINQRQKIQWESIEIADDPDLLDRYAIKIPVIKRLDNNKELNWPFRESEILDFLTTT